MIKCLWCQRTELEATFLKKAHTIPESLGGKNICENVCDKCNAFFGNKRSPNNIAIEEVLKEAFNISRERLRTPDYLSAKKYQKKRFKSRFFTIKSLGGKKSLKIKPSFKLRSGFQSKLCRLFKRGLYKMYLEELNRQKNIGFESQYDFIREFARYDIGELPIFYFERTHGMLFVINGEAENPELLFDRNKYLINEYGFGEIEFLGHLFAFPTTRHFELQFDSYIRKSAESKRKFFKNVKEMKYLTDMDITLSIMND